MIKLITKILFLLFLLGIYPVLAQRDSVGLDQFNYRLAQQSFRMFEDLVDAEEEEIGEKKLTYKEFLKKFKEKILKNSLQDFEYVDDHFPESRFAIFTLADKGRIEMKLGRFDEAERTFVKLIQKSKADSSAEEFAKNSLINFAIKNLVNISIIGSSYSRGLELLDSLKYYSRVYMCGEEGREDRDRIDQLYGKCYIGLGKTEKGLALLIPQILDSYPLLDSTHVDYTFSILVKLYGKEELRKKFLEATDLLKEDRNYGWKVTYMEFLGSKVQLFSTRNFQYELKSSQLQKIYKDSKFYRLLFG